jgi:hypothetical protein
MRKRPSKPRLAPPGESDSNPDRVTTNDVLQRAVEDEITAFLAHARYQRTDAARRWRSGRRLKRLQTEGEIVIQMPQLRVSIAAVIEPLVAADTDHPAKDMFGSPSQHRPNGWKKGLVASMNVQEERLDPDGEVLHDSCWPVYLRAGWESCREFRTEASQC